MTAHHWIIIAGAAFAFALALLPFWWRRRHRRSCDMCAGKFREERLTPVSGDWWLCDPCFRKYMRPE